MADLKPIGSEKLQGLEKINRILEIARYKENIPSNLNETSRVEFERVLADGNHYEIVKEKSGYVIKKRVDESLEYIEPMKNRKHYGSYSAALKRLNLIAGEVNRLTENEEEVSMYNLGEQKKFTLKTPKPAMPEPAVAPELPMPPAAPEADSMDDAALDAPEGEEMDFDMDLDTPEGDMDVDMSAEEEPMDDQEEVTFKTIQKLTGKLGQKIRMMNDSVGMTSEDVKYVINSLLSALDLSKLDEEDQEDIMAKFEEDQESGYDSDMDMGSMGDDDELDMDMEMDVEEPMDGEMEEGMYGSFGDTRRKDYKGDVYYDEKDRPVRSGDIYGIGGDDFDTEEFDTFQQLYDKYGDKQSWFNKRDGETMFNKYREMTGKPFKVKTRKMDGEMGEDYEDSRYSEDYDEDYDSKKVKGYSNNGAIFDSIFGESKVDKVISKYFEVSKKEIREGKEKQIQEIAKKKAVVNQIMESVVKMTETIEQELTAKKFLKENINSKFIGITNKKNLVFETKTGQVRITPNGDLI